MTAIEKVMSYSYVLRWTAVKSALNYQKESRLPVDKPNSIMLFPIIINCASVLLIKTLAESENNSSD